MSQRVDFDDYAADYEEMARNNVSFFDRNGSYFARYKVQLTCNLTGPVGGNIMDFGCGTGQSIPFLHQYFPLSRIVGCDISRRSLQSARLKYPFADFFHPEELPPGLGFDVIFSAGVFHHVPVDNRRATLEFCRSRLTHNGNLIIFEHNPYNPVTRKVVSRCAFDKDAILLTQKELVRLLESARLLVTHRGYTLFFPRRLRLLRPMERYFGRIPLGGQYYVSGRCGT